MARPWPPDRVEPLARLLASGGSQPRSRAPREDRRVAFGSPRIATPRRVVLSELPGVGVEMYHLEPRRHGIDVGRERRAVRRSPPTENRTSASDRISALRAPAGANGPRNSGCDAGNDAVFATPSGVDRRAERLRHGDELGVRVAVGARRRRPGSAGARPREQLGGGVHRRAVAADPRRDARRRAQLDDRLRPEERPPGSDRKTGPVGGASAVFGTRGGPGAAGPRGGAPPPTTSRRVARSAAGRPTGSAR